MSRVYSENTIREMIKKALKTNPLFIYQENFLNYKGRTKDSQKYYSEVIANELVENYHQLTQLGKDVSIRRTRSFNAYHNGIPNVDARIERFEYLKFSEKLLAIALFNSNKNYCFGKIIDYQVPLKEKQSDKFGEIDLVAQKDCSLKLIELKIKGGNEETLLRALLEVYTYYKLINNSLDKFIKDFQLENGKRLFFQPAILSDRTSLSGETMEAIDDCPNMKRLVSKINEEIKISVEFYTYNFDSKKVIQNEADYTIVLDGDIQINEIKY